MAQYDIVFAINTASTGVVYEERSIKLTKGELLVGTSTTPVALPAGQDGKILAYDSSMQSGFAAIAKNVFEDLTIDYAYIRNNSVPYCYLYIGDDGIVEIVSTQNMAGDGSIDLRSQSLHIHAQDFYLQNIPGTGSHLTIDASGKVSKTTISGGGTSLWTENGVDIYRASRVGVKNLSPSYDLDVTGNARMTSGVYTTKVYGSSDTNTYLDWVSADQLRVIVGGIEMMRFVESTEDRIGVKLSSPSYDFDVNGDIHASGDILSNSDVRLKKNIFSMPSIRDKVKKLRPVIFDWRESGKSDFGLIAQEVEKLFPCIVRTDEHDFKSVNYQKLTVLLLKALQEVL